MSDDTKFEGSLDTTWVKSADTTWEFIITLISRAIGSLLRRRRRRRRR
jgi:hypothetical protein|tara:strand:+ start:7175 stop:7318 length:144 start_codon:yes stop_codon:yes gene_type:complete